MTLRRASVRVVLVGTLAVLTVLVLRGDEPDDDRWLPFDEGRRAVPADDVVDSVGVNTHLHYRSTPYGDFEAVEAALRELGIRHIRDYPVPDNIEEVQRLASVGIRLTAIMGVPTPTDWMPHDLEDLLKSIELMEPGVAALEGVNEWDISDDPDWVDNLRTHQEALWQFASARESSIPVLAPSVTWADNMPEVGDMSNWADAGNIHPYPGGRPPEARVADDLAANRRFVVNDKPVLVTETGYHDAFEEPHRHPGVPAGVAAIYLPRLLLHYFDIGIERTFLYELVDQRDSSHPESSFGLLEHDFDPKPSYEVIQALLGTLADPGQPFETGRLEFRLESDDDLLRHLLLQQRDGTFHLAVWREISVWDRDERRMLDPGTTNVRLAIDSPAGVERILGLEPGSVRTDQLDSSTSVELEVGPFVQLVEIRPHEVRSGR